MIVYKGRLKRPTGCGSVWLERRLREAEAASSNLVTPTEEISRNVNLFFVAQKPQAGQPAVIFYTIPLK